MSRPTLVIVDDHPCIIEALQRSLRKKLKIVGTARNAQMGLAMVMADQPDLVILDVNMPGMGAFEACEVITNRTDSKVLFYTGGHRQSWLDRAYSAGASGIASKDTEWGTEIASILIHIHLGGTYWSPDWIDRLRAISTHQENLSPLTQLTPRQQAILQKLCCGMTNGEVCESLEISLGTYKNDIGAAMTLLEAHTELELMAAAAAEGVVSHDMCSTQG